MLGYGKVLNLEDRKLAIFTISDREVLKKTIFPIFDKHTLLTSKQFFYLKFKQALYTFEDETLTFSQKSEALDNIINTVIPNNYISPSLTDFRPML